MATDAIKSRCITCDKEKRTVRCEGCLQLFCYDHLTDHRQELNKQLHHIELNLAVFRQTLNEQTNHPQIHSLIKEINKWEEESIHTIQKTAMECREVLLKHSNEHFNDVEINLTKLSEQLKDIHQENDFNEIDLNQFNLKLKQLSQELDKLSTISIQQETTPLIHKISVFVSTVKAISSININNHTKWKQYGSTIAGGYGEGDQSNQLYWPYGICVDDDQTIYIADWWNHRIVKWKYDTNHGQVVAGGNGKGNRRDQLNLPTDVILDKNNDALIICDWGNRRVVRWSRRNTKNRQTIISKIDCSQLTIDHNGDLYVSDWRKNEVRRWKQNDKKGIVVAGGNGKGDHLNQLNFPTYIFVDKEESVYVSDSGNDRVMKWMSSATEGIVVAGGQGEGDNLAQLSYPEGIIVDHLGNVYVADSGNNRIMRWSKGSREGSIIVRGNGEGKQPNQFNCPICLSFDQEGNLYVVDWGNHRVQKFDVEVD
ncbi:unnamed protein product [Adineta steineri]|uniref:Uncharacterized protein n=2 Tax=Adineta steineri TaxID=433720 RepID=A0A814A270_9BILA|nr:unnamed protein product [Adineta steineri]CAF0906560.1 unnamed protein product [Adineta steineri]CAF3936294.1 unnamed protein product [Adineta steineri]CAF4056403.1 unnamed protein product [Adineta steineri]